MKNIDIIRAWKDRNYRDSLSKADRATLAANPAGSDELSDEALKAVAGGVATITVQQGPPTTSSACCKLF